MSRMNAAYGSELHLLRYLGRHRADLDRRVLAELGEGTIDWLDFNYDQTPAGQRKAHQPWDSEIKGLEFLTDRPEVREAWTHWWPQGPGTMTWDAVGRWTSGETSEWLLVEAKANVQELSQSCKARLGPGLDQIRSAFAATKKALGVDPTRNWETGYYQAANRLATLHFLTEHHVPARLLFVYFMEDAYARCDCPKSPEEWQDQGLKRMKEHLGLPAQHLLTARVHDLFIPVRRLAPQ